MVSIQSVVNISNLALEYGLRGASSERRTSRAYSNPLKPEGEWVAKIDLVQEGDQLLLGHQPSFGHCEKECRTIEQACNDVIDKADTEFTEICDSSP